MYLFVELGLRLIRLHRLVVTECAFAAQCTVLLQLTAHLIASAQLVILIFSGCSLLMRIALTMVVE